MKNHVSGDQPASTNPEAAMRRPFGTANTGPWRAGACLALRFLALVVILATGPRTAMGSLPQEIRVEFPVPAAQAAPGDQVFVSLRFHNSETAVQDMYRYVTPAAVQVDGSGWVRLRCPVTLTGDQLNRDLWLEAALGTGPGDGSDFRPLPARIKLSPVPSALNADQLDGLDSSDFVTLGTAQIVTGQKTFSSPSTFKSAVEMERSLALRAVVNEPGPNLSFVEVEGEATGAGVTSLAGLSSRAMATGAGSSMNNRSAVRGVLAQGTSDGLSAAGLSAAGFYIGRNGSYSPTILPQVSGVTASARFGDPDMPRSTVMDAIAVSAQAIEEQSGPNTGVRGLARGSSQRNLGLQGIAGVTDAEMLRVPTLLPTPLAAGVFAYAPAGRDSYALYTVGDVALTSGGLRMDESFVVTGAYSRVGSGADAAQLAVVGTVTDPAALDTSSAELHVQGDAWIDGTLAVGDGALRLGQGPGVARVEAPGPVRIDLVPGSGEVRVEGRIAQSGTPARPGDLATKGYVDGAVESAPVVRLDGDQAIAGHKSFTGRVDFAGEARGGVESPARATAVAGPGARRAVALSAESAGAGQAAAIGIDARAGGSDRLNVGLAASAGVPDALATSRTLELAARHGAAGAAAHFHNPARGGVAVVADAGDRNGLALSAIGSGVFSGSLTIGGAGNTVGNGGATTQVLVRGNAQHDAADLEAGRDVIVDGDALVRGDLAVGDGTLRLGRIPGGDYYIRAGDATAALNIAPASGRVDVAADMRLAREGAQYGYGQPRQRHLAIPAATFAPSRSGYAFSARGASLADASTTADPGGQVYYAPVNLPGGATVTGIELQAFDNAPDAGLTFALHRVDGPAMAVVGRGGPTADNPADQAVAGTIEPTPGIAVIDNGAFAYLAEIRFSSNNQRELAAHVFRITYTVTQAD